MAKSKTTQHAAGEGQLSPAVLDDQFGQKAISHRKPVGMPFSRLGECCDNKNQYFYHAGC